MIFGSFYGSVFPLTLITLPFKESSESQMIRFTDFVKFEDKPYLSEQQLCVYKLNHYFLVLFNMVLATFLLFLYKRGNSQSFVFVFSFLSYLCFCAGW